MPLPELYLTNTPEAGTYLAFPTDAGVLNGLKEAGSYARELAQIACEAFAHAGGRNVLVDIGANIGTFSVPVSRATKCAVYAFEAQRVIAQILGANFVLNGIGNAVVENVVLGAPGIPPTVDIPSIDYAQPGNFGAFATDDAVFSKHSARRMSVTGREAVKAAPLDSFRLQDVFFIKIDVEGAELDILKGATETLSRNAYPPVLAEAWSQDSYAAQKKELVSYLEGLGYEVADLGNENILAQHKARAKIHPPAR